MSTKIDKNLDLILKILFDFDESSDHVNEYMLNSKLQEISKLSPKEINDAIVLLRDYGLIQWFTSLGTAPYRFNHAKITSRGKYEFERKKALSEEVSRLSPLSEFKTSITSEREALLEFLQDSYSKAPPAPILSPFGFTDYDWEVLAKTKADKNTLYVVLGLKFKSKNYDTIRLIHNIRTHINDAIQKYNSKTRNNIVLNFKQLRAGYGEHLFNQISRDILVSDISIFDTSDLTPNVFLEIGVALTGGSRVFIIKKINSPSPSSDLSGQTYAEYSDNGNDFSDPDFDENVYRMVERAIMKK